MNLCKSTSLFPPKEKYCHCCYGNMQRHGSRYITVLMPWGKTRIRVVRWRCDKDQLVCTEYPVGMDKSGLIPEVLERCIDLCTRLPYREAQQALKIRVFA